MPHEYNKYNGYYYMHDTLRNFSEYGITNGLEFKYVIFNQADSKITALNTKSYTTLDIPVEMNSNDEFVMKLTKNFFFKFIEEKRSDGIFVKIRFYKVSNDSDNSFLTYGYKSDEVKSIEDAKAELEKYRKENEIFEENLPPGQE
ncbi:hypothetical protein [Leptospira meyeri]|uniref:hypothetical protein n=1 Tax=Leptospira meyeri TaxID=29508 RepID=UPI0010824F8A|nr:hypothetical protein [Leptospira meyeri]TGM20049.1 hypothetical protein EHQ73_17470 [Leptospira meyeri]